MKRFGALFDLDGVLVDSESLYTRFWDDMEKRHPTGIPNYAVAIKGMTLTRILENYEGESLKREVEQAIHDYEAQMVYPVMKGVGELLSAMHDAGWGTAIVTSSDSLKMERLFAGVPELKPMFDIIIDGSMVTKSKPDPEGYLRAANGLGYDPKDCFVFEDSLQGVAAGRASGATVIGLSTTFPRERLEQTGCTDIIVSSLEQVSLEKLRALKC